MPHHAPQTVDEGRESDSSRSIAVPLHLLGPSSCEVKLGCASVWVYGDGKSNGSPIIHVVLSLEHCGTSLSLGEWYGSQSFKSTSTTHALPSLSQQSPSASPVQQPQHSPMEEEEEEEEKEGGGGGGGGGGREKRKRIQLSFSTGTGNVTWMCFMYA